METRDWNDNTFKRIYEREVLEITKDGAYCSMWQFYQASNVICCPVKSVYPFGFMADGESDDIVHQSDAKESGAEGEEFDENENIMLFMDDDNVKNIEDMQGSERLQVFDKVNRLTKFPRYQPKPKESLLEIVIKSVGLMRLLKQNKKLVDL